MTKEEEQNEAVKRSRGGVRNKAAESGVLGTKTGWTQKGWTTLARATANKRLAFPVCLGV